MSVPQGVWVSTRRSTGTRTPTCPTLVPPHARTSARARRTSEPPEVGVTPTHTEKLMYPDTGITTGDGLDFYQRIATRLLPYLHDRPATLERLPEGLDGPDAPHFWQKRTPDSYPEWIEQVTLPSARGKEVQYVLVNDEARAWALGMAQRVVGGLRDRATTERSKAKRGKRVYVDVMQNAKGHHAVPPYVLRAGPGAPVSTPLHWQELTPHLDPTAYNLKTIFRRLARQQHDPMAGLLRVIARAA